jgi:hypothetical protein
MSPVQRQHLRTAAKLKAMAAELLAMAQFHIEQSREPAAERTPAVVLSGNARLAFDFIVSNPGRTGEEISAAIDCSAGAFRNKLVPKLKKAGVTCRTFGGGGYFGPAHQCYVTPSSVSGDSRQARISA